MSKVKEILENGVEAYSFYCPGCGHDHIFYVNIDSTPHWEFNGDVNNPTFKPSLLNRWGKYWPEWKPDPEDNWTQEQIDAASGQCHLHVEKGVINYCDDCTHAYAGKKEVPMVEY